MNVTLRNDRVRGSHQTGAGALFWSHGKVKLLNIGNSNSNINRWATLSSINWKRRQTFSTAGAIGRARRNRLTVSTLRDLILHREYVKEELVSNVNEVRTGGISFP